MVPCALRLGLASTSAPLRQRNCLRVAVTSTRSDCALAYVPSKREVVCFGGYRGGYLDETLVYKR